MIWEIYGAEQFIGIKDRKVTFITNEIWQKIDKKHYQQLKSKHANFTRFRDYFSYFRRIRFGAKTSEEDLDLVDKVAP